MVSAIFAKHKCPLNLTSSCHWVYWGLLVGVLPIPCDKIPYIILKSFYNILKRNMLFKSCIRVQTLTRSERITNKINRLFFNQLNHNYSTFTKFTLSYSQDNIKKRRKPVRKIFNEIDKDSWKTNHSMAIIFFIC